MDVLKALNMALAFALELIMLYAIGLWGYGLADETWARWVLALGLPALVAIIWGLFFAPRATRRLSLVPGTLLSLGLFLISASALYFAGQKTLAAVLAVVALVNRALVFAWRQW